jgi:hypothetical protein
MFREDCPCPKKKCVRHGKCDECTRYHGAKGKLPYCKRPKRSLFGFLKKK